MQRRTFFKLGAGAAIAGGPFAGFVNSPAGASALATHPRSAWSPSRTSATAWCGCTCPRASSTARSTTPSSRSRSTTARRLPGRHDGMGAFGNADGTVTLVRNHEVNGSRRLPSARPSAPVYDSAAGGGTTSVMVDLDGNVDDAITSLSGTMMNCSGGIMPWGSWITCEETVNGPDVGPDYTGTPEHRPEEAARLRLRGPRRRSRHRRADHQRRPLLPRGGVVGRQVPVPHRGQLRLRLRLLPLQAAERA